MNTKAIIGKLTPIFRCASAYGNIQCTRLRLCLHNALTIEYKNDDNDERFHAINYTFSAKDDGIAIIVPYHQTI